MIKLNPFIIPIFQECCFLLSAFEDAIAHGDRSNRSNSTVTQRHPRAVRSRATVLRREQCLWSVCVTISKILASKVLNSTPKIVIYRSCLKRLIVLLFGAALHAKDTVTRFGSEAFAHGKLDVLPCKHSNPTLLWTLNWYLNSARAFLAAVVLPTGLSQLRHQRQLFEKAIPISVDSNLCLHDGHKRGPGTNATSVAQTSWHCRGSWTFWVNYDWISCIMFFEQ